MKHIVFDCDGTLIDTTFMKAYPGVKELLEILFRENKLYVWTIRDRASTIRILTENGIWQYFESIFTISDGPPKPHPMGLMTMLDGVPRSSICIIGDSSNDMMGARDFGVLAIGAVWNIQAIPSILENYGADFIVSHPSECSSLIELNLTGDNDV